MEHLKWLYPLSSTLLTAFYIPQIVAAARAKSGLREISLLSWGIWTICISVSCAYSYFIAQDMKITLFNFANASCCLVVFIIAAGKRIRYR